MVNIGPIGGGRNLFQQDPQGQLILDNPAKPVTDNILALSNLTADTGFITAEESAASHLRNALVNEFGMQNALRLQEFSNDQNNQLDLQLLQSRQNYGVFNKQIEQYLLDEMVKEKLDNMFYELERTEMQNRFSLAKTVVGAARYG